LNFSDIDNITRKEAKRTLKTNNQKYTQNTKNITKSLPHQVASSVSKTKSDYQKIIDKTGLVSKVTKGSFKTKNDSRSKRNSPMVVCSPMVSSSPMDFNSNTRGKRKNSYYQLGSTSGQKTCFWRDGVPLSEKHKSFKIQPRPSSYTRILKFAKATSNTLRNSQKRQSDIPKSHQSVSHSNTAYVGRQERKENDQNMKFISRVKKVFPKEYLSKLYSHHSKRSSKTSTENIFIKGIIGHVQKFKGQFAGLVKCEEILEKYLIKCQINSTFGATTIYLSRLVAQLLSCELDFSQSIHEFLVKYQSKGLQDIFKQLTESLGIQPNLPKPNKKSKNRVVKKQKSHFCKSVDHFASPSINTQKSKDENSCIQLSKNEVVKSAKLRINSGDFTKSPTLQDISNFTPEGYSSSFLKCRVNKLKDMAKKHIRMQSEERVVESSQIKEGEQLKFALCTLTNVKTIGIE